MKKVSHKQMKYPIRLLFYAACSISLLALSCEKTSEAPAAKAARAEVTISNYFNEDGAKSLKIWETRDVVAFISAGTVSTTQPLAAGSQTSRFTLSTSAKEGDNITAYYPTVSGKYENGVIKANLSASQNGKVSTFYVGNGAFSESSQTNVKIALNPLWCTVYAKVAIGDYAVKKAVFKGNNNEKIAGAVTINPDNLSVEATETTITVELPTALDCRLKEVQFPILVAPVTFSKGYTVTYTTEAGAELTFTSQDSVTAQAGGMIAAGGSTGNESTQLLVCGDNMIYHINADIALEKGFMSSIIWQWSSLPAMSVVGKDGLRLDDCKPVDNNTKILATSSRGYAVLIDRATGDLLWWTNSAPNAHSADLLPGGRIAVACSEKGDALQIYDIRKNNTILFSTPLLNGHGVVWNEKDQTLYAAGEYALNSYKLKDWETESPQLTLQKTVDVKKYAPWVHELSLVDSKTLLIASQKAALYDIEKGTFVPLEHFAAMTGIKSVNYNITTGDCWYVDSTQPEGEFTWSSKTIRYTDDIYSAQPAKKTIPNVPINMYKVRVLHW